jgi:hypothetical protein
MSHRSNFKELPTLEFRLIQEAVNLRKQAEGMPLGIRRDELLRKAGQMVVAVHINEWLTSPGLRPPTLDSDTVAWMGKEFWYSFGVVSLGVFTILLVYGVLP